MVRYPFITGANFISIIIVVIIMTMLLVENKELERRHKAFIPLCFFQILQCALQLAVNCYGFLFSDGLLLILTGLVKNLGFLITAIFTNYIYAVAEMKRINGMLKKVFSFMIILSLAGFVFCTAFSLTGRMYAVEAGNVVTYDAIMVEYIWYSIIYVLNIIFTVKYSSKIGYKDAAIFLIYYFFPIAGILTGMFLGEEYSWEIAGGAISILMVYLTLQYKRKNRQEREYLSYFKSIANSFDRMYIIDRTKNTYIDLSNRNRKNGYMYEHKCERDIQEVIWDAVAIQTSEQWRDSVRRFLNLSSLYYRLAERHQIDFEVINTANRWVRYSFIKIDRHVDNAVRYMFIVQDVDDSKRREEVLTAISNTDELTKLYNRHALETDISQWKKNGMPPSLWYVNIDLNGLKQTNDTLGHSAGDEIIKGMGECLAVSVGTLGKAYRVGGDEFIVILNCAKSQKDGFLGTLENMRYKWQGKYSDEFSYSIGVVGAIEMPGASFTELQHEADERMYANKKQYYITHEDRRIH